MGYGRKWWMPEWYLAYRMGMTYIGGTVMITVRGTLSLQNRSQVVGTVGPEYWSPVHVNKTGPRWWEPLGQNTGPRCMSTIIRSSISSPSTSVNNPRLAYIWMYVCWGAHLDTYLDIWVRRVIIIIIIDTVMDIVVILEIPVMTSVTFPCCVTYYDSSDDSGYDLDYDPY